jgi:hypothetical protein
MFIDTKGLLSASSLEKMMVRVVFVIGLIFMKNLIVVGGRNNNSHHYNFGLL